MKNFLIKILVKLGHKIYHLFFYHYINLKFNGKTNYLNFKSPVRFNHKIIWLKKNYNSAKFSNFADKIKVKEFVEKKIGKNFCIPTIKIFNSAEDISLKDISYPIIIKTNHGSNFNMIIKNPNSIDLNFIKKKYKEHLDVNYFDISREHQYKNIIPKVFIEPFLYNKFSDSLLDYKFFCFNGVPEVVQVDFNRFTKHTRNFYDLAWKKLDVQVLYPNNSNYFPKPKLLKKMIEISKTLSKDFPFIRVDLYQFSNKVLFGELTFHPEGGFSFIKPDSYDYLWGSKLDLKKLVNK